MYMRFKMQEEKIIHSILFILNKLGGNSDLHKVFKVLYFADQKHIVQYGVPITGDFYIAMKNGPVPSKSYDVLKAIRGDSFFGNSVQQYKTYFEVTGFNVSAKTIFDAEELSESNIDCMNEAINENKNLTFIQLTEKSHQSAWKKAINNADNLENEINIFDIAREGEANEEMIKYITINLENQTLLKKHAELR
jgi:uncharacterized phage-associated protein